MQASEEIYDELMADRIWAGTRALAQQHLDAGQRVWLVTATPVELASIIARRLGLTGALGTVAEVVDGKYTGRLVGELMHGPAKAEAVLALAEREGLDLARCTAYSDSANDLPMLSLTGTAVAVNPDTELRAIARSRGWLIRDFRTGRKAAKFGLPAVGAAALSGAAVGGAIALRRRDKFPGDPPDHTAANGRPRSARPERCPSPGRSGPRNGRLRDNDAGARCSAPHRALATTPAAMPRGPSLSLTRPFRTAEWPPPGQRRSTMPLWTPSATPTVSRRRSCAAGAAGRASAGWSRAPGR